MTFYLGRDDTFTSYYLFTEKNTTIVQMVASYDVIDRLSNVEDDVSYVRFNQNGYTNIVLEGNDGRTATLNIIRPDGETEVHSFPVAKAVAEIMVREGWDKVTLIRKR